jgi:hypothetical protein
MQRRWVWKDRTVARWLAKVSDDALQGRLIAISVISWGAIISSVAAIVRLWA